MACRFAPSTEAELGRLFLPSPLPADCWSQAGAGGLKPGRGTAGVETPRGSGMVASVAAVPPAEVISLQGAGKAFESLEAVGLEGDDGAAARQGASCRNQTPNRLLPGARGHVGEDERDEQAAAGTRGLELFTCSSACLVLAAEHPGGSPHPCAFVGCPVCSGGSPWRGFWGMRFVRIAHNLHIPAGTAVRGGCGAESKRRGAGLGPWKEAAETAHASGYCLP